MDFQESIIAENNKLQQDAEKYRQDANLPGFWVAQKGENYVSILPELPREKDFGQGVRKIFEVKGNGEKKDWAVNPQNPIYKEVIRALVAGKRDLCLLRTGEKQATRYELLDKPTPKQ